MNNYYPTLFVPHGAPDFALNSGQAGMVMYQFAQTLKPPQAILIISAHWSTTDITVGTAPFPQTIHDFWGFDEKLYTIQYPVKNHLSLHNTVIHQFHQNGFTVKTDQHHGLDHGAWIPLRIMFPNADIPVIPISIQSHQNPEYHFKIGQALSNLTQEGFLIICSGNLTHNLRDYHIAARRNKTPEYVQKFSEWFSEKIKSQDINDLLNYRKLAPYALQAHPTEEHLLPIFIALGAAGKNYSSKCLYSGIDYFVISMNAYIFRNNIHNT